MINKPFLYAIMLMSLSILGLAFTDKIKQSDNYHNFADKRTCFDINNCADVITNIPLLTSGLYGLLKMKQGYIIIDDKRNEFTNFIVFFVGMILVGIGSAYYHLAPTTETLFWDRLPMTIVFMSAISILLAEWVNPKIGKLSLIPLLTIGISSVLYWRITETMGDGDLRPYYIIQVLPLLYAPVLTLTSKSKYTTSWTYVVAVIIYLISKLSEYYDYEIFNALYFLSGHNIKHLLIALAMHILIYGWTHRTIRRRLL
jgi:hypothetical protein